VKKEDLVVDAVPMSVEAVSLDELIEEGFAASSDTNNNNVAN